MGTNFYKVRIPSLEEIQKMHELVDSFKFTSSSNNPFSSVQNLLNQITEQIHIGKRSGGSQFLFNAHKGELYTLTKHGLVSWLNEGLYEIRDEYGDNYTTEEFMKMVKDWNSREINKSHHCLKTYGTFEEQKYWKDKNFTLNDSGDRFVSDGLTFSIFDDFC